MEVSEFFEPYPFQIYPTRSPAIRGRWMFSTSTVRPCMHTIHAGWQLVLVWTLSSAPSLTKLYFTKPVLTETWAHEQAD